MNDDLDKLPLERRPSPGSSIARPEDFAGARESFRKALAAFRAVGNEPPIGRNGKAQVWNETRGWHDDTTSTRPSGLRVSTLEARMRERAAHHAADNPRAIAPK